MFRFNEGRLFVAGRTGWPVGSTYAHPQDGHTLALFVREISSEQRLDLSRGRAELALIVDRRELVVCSRFGAALPWAHSSPFRRPRMHPADPLDEVAETVAGSPLTLRVALVEADSGRVCGVRRVRLTRAFAAALDAAALEPAAPIAASLEGREAGRVDWPAARIYRLGHEPVNE